MADERVDSRLKQQIVLRDEALLAERVGDLPTPVTDPHVRERARELGELILKRGKQKRGRIGKWFQRKQPQIDKKLVMSKNPEGLSIVRNVLLSPVFDETYDEAAAVLRGFRAGLVYEKLAELNRPPTITAQTNLDKLSLWFLRSSRHALTGMVTTQSIPQIVSRTVQNTRNGGLHVDIKYDTGAEEPPLYSVSLESGAVSSYDGLKREDGNLTLAKNASWHVLALIGQATEAMR